MNAYRDGTIYVQKDVLWMLSKVVKHQNAGGTGDLQAPSATVDGLATDILRQWVKAWHPELIKLRERRDAIDTEAEATLKTAAEKK